MKCSIFTRPSLKRQLFSLVFVYELKSWTFLTLLFCMKISQTRNQCTVQCMLKLCKTYLNCKRDLRRLCINNNKTFSYAEWKKRFRKNDLYMKRFLLTPVGKMDKTSTSIFSKFSFHQCRNVNDQKTNKKLLISSQNIVTISTINYT